jgi:hypothetical protein
MIHRRAIAARLLLRWLRLSVLAGFGLVRSIAFSADDSAFTPAPGSAERTAIMDAMRLDFYPGDRSAAHANPKQISFKVRFLKVHGDWACTDVEPVDAGGKVIAESRWGLLRRTGGQWSPIDYMEALRPFASEDAASNALDFGSATIARLRRVFPNAPGDIFPDH